jgi:acyl transferase domain-containing protein/acyl carrier protein
VSERRNGSEIAIVGMACRFPGAADCDEFWRNLREGRESLTWLSDDDLARSGITPREAASPQYVRRAAVLADVETFDAEFFGYTPAEARLIDPQQRLFLECAWEAFEQAGHVPGASKRPVGVFTGAKTNTYLLHLAANPELLRSTDLFQLALGNDLAMMATRVSYKLDLRGPSYALHTACSTSLVTVHLACQSLLLGECDMALAGGAAINVPHRQGYLYQKGGILSADGSCRTFDARADGSNFGNGAGAVLLKRLADAEADGDAIVAVIRGSATNNDGAEKASYAAPGVTGQLDVLLEALACAGVDAESISYVEAHGTATPLGDSIEVLALTEAFRASTARRGFCALGSVKTNIGHLETAAGIAGLIKTALALRHRQIPPSLHFERPNPNIDFAGSPFYVNTRLADWQSAAGPRRAGVSSFGIGSTNAHVILEEAPAAPPPALTRPWQLIATSARSAPALDRAAQNLARHLEAHPELDGPALGDVAYTLTVGRKALAHRRVVICRGGAAAATALATLDPAQVLTHRTEAAERPVVFLFPGLGEHYLGMGRGLYGEAGERGQGGNGTAGGDRGGSGQECGWAGEPVFRAELDRCVALLRPLLGLDLREALYPPAAAPANEGDGRECASPPAGGLDLRRMLGRGAVPPAATATATATPAPAAAAAERLNRTWLAQPALFAVEYALANLWMSWGVKPRAMAGYSLGEYVAACLAGVLTLPDALRLVAERARLIEELPGGGMLAVALSEAELAPLLARHGLSLAAVNGAAGCVAAGREAAIAELARALAGREIACRLLPTTHAFHTAELAPLAAPLTRLARSVALAPPRIPYLSNLTGDWITAEQATDPEYWARHMCQPVRFGDAMGRLLAEGGQALLEVGPGQGLGSFVRQEPLCDDAMARAIFASLPNAYTRQPDLEFLLGTLGKLWLTGQQIDWQAFWSGERRRRVPLPTYPFERRRHWVDLPHIDRGQAPAAMVAATVPREAPGAGSCRRVTLDKQLDPADWLYQPVWRRTPLPAAGGPRAADGPWLLLADRDALGAAVAARLRRAGCAVLAAAAVCQGEPAVLPSPGAGAAVLAAGSWAIDPADRAHYEALLAALTSVAAAAPPPIAAAAAPPPIAAAAPPPIAAPVDTPATAAAGAPAALHVLHLWNAAPAADGDGGERLQELGFYSLLALAQALGRRQGGGGAARITVVSSQLQRVTGSEELVPEKATLLGPCRVIPQEQARVSCRCADVEAAGTLAPEALDALAGLLLADAAAADPGAETVIAYRTGAPWKRWAEDFARVSPPADAVPGADARGSRGGVIALRQGGVYLLTGGLGGVGLELAEHLARTVRARLVLTGRSALPPPEEWDGWLAGHAAGDRVSGRILRLRRLEALGAEVMAVAADAADLERMREVVAAARQRFGAIHGVVHLAGTPGGGIIQLKTRQAAARIMAPKVAGARVLEALFPRPDDLDFLVLFSSIASILGEIGQVDYCGANAYLDCVAQRNASRGWPPTVTVDSDIWREVGLAVHTEVPEHLRPWRQEMLAQALSPAEGVEAFARALRCGVPQVVVSAQPLAGRIELGKSFTGESFLAALDQGKARPPMAAGRVLGTGYAAAGSTLEHRIADIWQRRLGVERVGVHDNFFDLGGNSLLGLQVVAEIGRELGIQVAPVTLFESPTVAALARQLAAEAGAAGGAAAGETAAPDATMTAGRDGMAADTTSIAGQGTDRGPAAAPSSHDIAIIAMTGRFPGAPSVEHLWRNLRAGVESVRFFTDDELAAAGVDAQLAADPRYVKAGAILDGIDLFDAGLFGISPREAEVTDPQHRIFLECAWEALERAGYDSSTYPGRIGVFAGANLSTYLLRLFADPAARASVNMLQAILGNDKDSLTTLASYKLNLRGPSVAVQTFCSTSLVAVHMACRSLRGGECDMALAGGVRIVVPDHQGYLYEPGGLAPADGHSRSFDAKATGSILGHGAGIVCLKRLAEALADGDPVLAVIKGSAINNDGSLKAGYTAPSVNGQAEAIAAAFADAGVTPDSVSYLEAHGSATGLGDPIELAALTKAFRRFTSRQGYCPIGSVKSNFGHLDRAAGVTGLIKTVLALEHGELPPSINFDEPNPQIDFAASPFFVNTALRPWERGETPRRAAVNSLGMGGTNVHVVVEEAPLAPPSTSPSRPWQLLALSAKTPSALQAATANLRGWLDERPALDAAGLADAAHTLGVGRRALPYRRAVVCRDAAEAAAALGGGGPARFAGGDRGERQRPVVFAFSGLGGHYAGMGRGLYAGEPAFRETVDRCAALLEPLLGLDLRQLLYPAGGDAVGEDSDGGAQPAVDLRGMLRRGAGAEGGWLDDTRLIQPALFVVEVALAQLLMAWGIRPQAVLGYSLGEYAAATVAGVLSLADALALVAGRARLIAELPAGAMLAVGLAAEELQPLLGEELSLAAINGPEQSVAAGSPEAVAALEALLASRGAACRRLRTSHAFHSRQMAAIFDRAVALAAGVELRPPAIPCLSNVSGTWLTAEQATDPTYWARHMCEPVRFSTAIAELRREPGRVVVELGPGKSLGSLILQHPSSRDGEETAVLAAMRHSYEAQPDQRYALTALAKLWLLGVEPDWAGLHAGERRRRVLLPTYPFERQRYWIETADLAAPAAGRPALAAAASPASPAPGSSPSSHAAPEQAEEAAARPAPAAAPAGAREHRTAAGAGGAAGFYPRPSLRVEYVAPRNELEHFIGGIWEELLGVAQVGIHDNFLDLGGDSLLATRLVARMRDAIEVELPVRLFFERSTVAELAAAVGEIRREQEAREARELLDGIQGLSEAELESEILRLERQVESEELASG